MAYTDKALEELIIPLRKLHNEGNLTDEKFFEIRSVFENLYTSLNAFLKSIDQDSDYNIEDTKAYLRQYLDEHDRLMEIYKN
ncbi:MAG: hypothetical protein GW903_00045 [Alphaproteobacteria bacterium]|nr:hypothetical protein [Alphaproteobacteria bacterium]NCQ87360.1 hypothetical protein [Alphaproteobacteria bacterium]NCT06231.1 hypothetical protein [Alphaproteobacteria bacterium]